jgi:hypothetical protein
MNTVSVFISTGRFPSFEAMRGFIDKTYTEDGDSVASEFGEEVGLSEYEPMCIEAITSETGQPVALSELLAGASWALEWLLQLDTTRLADAAICVFPPNTLERPEESSLEYLGNFSFQG